MEVDQPAQDKTDTTTEKKGNATPESTEMATDQNENANSTDKPTKENQDESSDSTPPKPPETEHDRVLKDAQLSTAAAAALGAAAVKAKVTV